MENEVKLVDVKQMQAITIRTFAPVEDLPRVIGEAYGKLMGFLGSMGKGPAGIPYIAYHNLDMKNLDLEIGFPVAEKIESKGEFKSGVTASGQCVEAFHKGSYASMTSAYDKISRWFEGSGYAAAGPYYEFYYNSPAEVPESELLTRILVPVRKK